jgi:hypothetical protein
MLLYTFERCAKRLVAILEFLLVIVDPVIRTRTEEGMLSLEMRMLLESQ